jgi:hypothetical protein
MFESKRLVVVGLVLSKDLLSPHSRVIELGSQLSTLSKISEGKSNLLFFG